MKFTEPLQSCCCPVQKYLPWMAELAWQLSRYLWRGSVNFKTNSTPLFTIIFKLKNDNFKTRDFSPLIESILAGVSCFLYIIAYWNLKSRQGPNLAGLACHCLIIERLLVKFLRYWVIAVSKGGIQIKKGFWLQINIPKRKILYFVN